MHLNTQTDCSWAKLTSFIFLRTLTLLCVRQINFKLKINKIKYLIKIIKGILHTKNYFHLILYLMNI